MGLSSKICAGSFWRQRYTTRAPRLGGLCRMKHEGAAFWGLGGGHDSPSFFPFVHFEDTTFQPEFIFLFLLVAFQMSSFLVAEQ